MRELRDELEVPGHVLAWKIMTVSEMTDRMREIIAKHESEGKSKLSEIPEGPDKQELRQLAKRLGMAVLF